jgi:hypothetical protein
MTSSQASNRITWGHNVEDRQSNQARTNCARHVRCDTLRSAGWRNPSIFGLLALVAGLAVPMLIRRRLEQAKRLNT